MPWHPRFAGTATGRYHEYRHHCLLERLSWRLLSDLHRWRTHTRDDETPRRQREGTYGTFAPPSSLRCGVKRTDQVGIEAALPNRPLAVIGDAIDSFVRKQGMQVQPDFVGHGVGRVFHTTPYDG